MSNPFPLDMSSFKVKLALLTAASSLGLTMDAILVIKVKGADNLCIANGTDPGDRGLLRWDSNHAGLVQGLSMNLTSSADRILQQEYELPEDASGIGRNVHLIQRIWLF